MKQLFTFLLLVNGLWAFGQADTAWTPKNAELYGTKADYIYQQSLKTKSDNPNLVRFVGYKRVYADELASYIQTKLNYTLRKVNPKNEAKDLQVFTSNEVYRGKRPPKKITVAFIVDDKEKVVTGTITGPFAELSSLFINYWPKDPSFKGEIPINQGVVAVKHSFGDLISFSWNGSDPSLIITKDPKYKPPVTRLAASH